MRPRTLIKKGLWQVFSGAPMWALRKMTEFPLTALCYHLVSDDQPAHVRSLFECHGVDWFERDLDFLLAHHTVVSLDDLQKRAQGAKTLPKNSLFLSFDDGYRECVHTIRPILLRKGVPATFFLTSAFIDNRILGYRHKASLLIARCEKAPGERVQVALAKLTGGPRGTNREAEAAELLLSIKYRDSALLDGCAMELDVDFGDYLRTERPYLTSDDVTQLVNDGLTIGGHSVDHPRYSELSLTDQLIQTRQCMSFLKRFGTPVKAFAFPFVSDGVEEGFYDSVFADEIADLVFCIGSVPNGAGARVIQRFGVEGKSVKPIEQVLREEYARRSVTNIAVHFPPSAPVPSKETTV
ncbi:MAG TPA: polysaccharide deacetylase family protein [Blastocatellia bacterium]